MKRKAAKNSRQIRVLSHYLPLVVWLAFISYASTDSFSAGNTSRIIGPLVLWLFPHTTAETLDHIHFITRKAAHFTEYAILGFLCARAFRASSRSTINQGWFFISLGLIVAYASIDEYHQSFVPSRTASIFDSLIDIAGGLTALITISRRTAKRS